MTVRRLFTRNSDSGWIWRFACFSLILIVFACAADGARKAARQDKQVDVVNKRVGQLRSFVSAYRQIRVGRECRHVEIGVPPATWTVVDNGFAAQVELNAAWRVAVKVHRIRTDDLGQATARYETEVLVPGGNS